jgi:hypothetical protein
VSVFRQCSDGKLRVPSLYDFLLENSIAYSRKKTSLRTRYRQNMSNAKIEATGYTTELTLERGIKRADKGISGNKAQPIPFEIDVRLVKMERP